MTQRPVDDVPSICWEGSRVRDSIGSYGYSDARNHTCRTVHRSTARSLRNGRPFREASSAEQELTESDRVVALIATLTARVVGGARAGRPRRRVTATVAQIVEEMPLHDHVQLYLREMARTALLTAEEEVDLAKRYEAGLEAERLIGEAKKLPIKRRRQLNQVDRDGKRAKERLVQANLRLVVSVAKRYQGQGLPLLDLIQEGNLGLLRAVEKFDYRRGYKFSTYATWWIRQAVGRGVADKGRTIRLPVHMMERVRRALSMQRDLAESLGREPSMEELAEELGEEVGTVEELLTYARTPTSLETPVGEDGDAELGDFIEDRNADDPLEVAAKGLARQELLDVVAGLPERERIILELRFGLLDGEARTLDDVGRYFGLTRERIRQLEARALSKLRHPSRGRALSDNAA
jgi:RNA polymerase primary sigma factor